MPNYFSVGVDGKLRFNQSDSSEEIADFKIEFQGKFDIAAVLYEVNKDDPDKLYQQTIDKNKKIEITQITPHQVDIQQNKKVKITRFIKCGVLKAGTLNEYENPTVIEDQSSAEIEIDLQSIAQWQKNTRIYFSNQLADQSPENLLKAKAGFRPRYFGPFEGCKMTFMIDSKIYYDSKNRILKDPLPLKIFNFCYPDFNHLDPIIKANNTQIANALQEMMRINLLAIIDEAQKQKKTFAFYYSCSWIFFCQCKWSQ